MSVDFSEKVSEALSEDLKRLNEGWKDIEGQRKALEKSERKQFQNIERAQKRYEELLDSVEDSYMGVVKCSISEEGCILVQTQFFRGISDVGDEACARRRASNVAKLLGIPRKYVDWDWKYIPCHQKSWGYGLK
jgi:hypothetical protein